MQQPAQIIATCVPADASSALVRGHFGPAGRHLCDMVRTIVKHLVFSDERHTLVAFTLSNTGLFIAPDCAHKVKVRGLEGCPLSPEAAGILCTMVAYQRLHGARIDPLFGRAFFNLREYAAIHPEWHQIRQLID